MEYVKIIIHDAIKSDTAVSTSDGNIVFGYIDRAIARGEKVELDFTGIDFLITAFLNAAIGQLYSKYKSEELNESILLKNVADEDKEQFVKVIARAKEYFANKKDFEDTANSTLYGK